MPDALVFDSVSKHYRGSKTYRALRDDLASPVRRLLGSGDRKPAEVIKALDGVSFAVAEGDAVGIVGVNGAGKTTMLKLATQITYPTSGVIRVRGAVGALLEVGTGMHPELTGRENMFLYGQILGFSRSDVKRLSDAIVEFAGIEAALDRPVKHYSSGMQLRLGFSIAIHLRPDVLLVDEAIAVGDAAFQYKCFERMAELRAEGRTLIFVSHDMNAVEALCQRVILLRAGRVLDDGDAATVIHAYLASVDRERAQRPLELSGPTLGIHILRVSLLDSAGNELTDVQAGMPLTIRLHFQTEVRIEHPYVSIGLSDPRIGVFAMASMLADGNEPEELSGTGYIDCRFAELPLNAMTFDVWMSIRAKDGVSQLVEWQRAKRFRVIDSAPSREIAAITTKAAVPVALPHEWVVHIENSPERGPSTREESGT